MTRPSISLLVCRSACSCDGQVIDAPVRDRDLLLSPHWFTVSTSGGFLLHSSTVARQLLNKTGVWASQKKAKKKKKTSACICQGYNLYHSCTFTSLTAVVIEPYRSNKTNLDIMILISKRINISPVYIIL